MGDPVSELESAEAALAAAIPSHDVQALQDLLHDDLVYTDPAGNVGGKTDDLAAHANEAFSINSFDTRELAIEIVGDRIAVTRALVDVEGEPFAGSLRYTRVWVHEANRWQVRVAHLGAVGQTPGR